MVVDDYAFLLDGDAVAYDELPSPNNFSPSIKEALFFQN